MIKADIANQITDLLGLPSVHFSTGSSEPKDLFVQIAESLGLNINENQTKPTIAKQIVESTGELWHPDFESRGSTVTLEGLIAVQSAVEFYLANRPEIN